MCIRDRTQGLFDVWAAAAAELGLKPVTAQARGGLSDGNWPVSYTHLRAHETVLDLVCRLLLEKKKNTLLTI